MKNKLGVCHELLTSMIINFRVQTISSITQSMLRERNSTVWTCYTWAEYSSCIGRSLMNNVIKFSCIMFDNETHIWDIAIIMSGCEVWKLICSPGLHTKVVPYPTLSCAPILLGCVSRRCLESELSEFTVDLLMNYLDW